jgi:hypothetical protein
MSSVIHGAHDVENQIRKAKAMLHTARSSKIPDTLKQLVYHFRVQRLLFKRTGFTKSFVVDRNLIFSGLTKRLKSAFWKHRIAPCKSDKRRKPQTSAGCYAGGRGAAHGRKVHQDFQRLVRGIAQPLNKQGGTSYVSKVDPCAYRLLVAMLQWGWVPIKSEFAIFDEHTRIATAIDCIAWDVRRHTGVVIEIKTGHESQTNYEATNRRQMLMPPLENVPDSPCNRAAVQLMVTLLILKRRYNVDFEQAAIVRPLSRVKDVQIYKIPRWAMLPNVQCAMYARLKETTGVHVERRVFKRTGTESQRAQMEIQESAQKAIEISIDPKADVAWSPALSVPVLECGKGQESPTDRNVAASVPPHRVLSCLDEIMGECEAMFCSTFSSTDSVGVHPESRPRNPRKRKRFLKDRRCHAFTQVRDAADELWPNPVSSSTSTSSPAPKRKRSARPTKITVQDLAWDRDLQEICAT